MAVKYLVTPNGNIPIIVNTSLYNQITQASGAFVTVGTQEQIIANLPNDYKSLPVVFPRIYGDDYRNFVILNSYDNTPFEPANPTTFNNMWVGAIHTNQWALSIFPEVRWTYEPYCRDNGYSSGSYPEGMTPLFAGTTASGIKLISRFYHNEYEIFNVNVGNFSLTSDYSYVPLFPEEDVVDGKLTHSGDICLLRIMIGPEGSGCKLEVYRDYNSAINAAFTDLLGLPITDATAPSTDDPYESGGISTAGVGGMGGHDTVGDIIGFPSLPDKSAVQSGLLNLYAGSSVDSLKGLANYLWSSAFDPATFKKLFSDPMQLIIGAAILPCTPSTAGSTIKFGNIDTQVSMPIVTNQYMIVDCGKLRVRENWGAYLDYSPYTKISIYLPYIGSRELNADEIMQKELTLKYYVDVLTGACTALIAVNDSVMYSFSGSLTTPIPITSSNWATVLSSIIQIAGAAVGGFAAGGAPMAATTGAASLASNALNGGLKPDYKRSGSVTGSAGLIGVQRPYLIYEIPRQSVPSGYAAFEGYPSNTTQRLSSCVGFTKIEEINIEGIGCTSAELNEIKELLKSGVIF